MLGYATTFLSIAFVAGIFGLVGGVGLAVEIARILFVVFLVLSDFAFLTSRHPPV